MEGKQNIRVASIIFVALLALTPAKAALGQPDAFDQLTPIEHQELSTVRGRDGSSMVTVQSNQSLSAVISDTAFTAGEINSGTVQLQTGALDNFNGVGLFNFVTGNGNAIDAAIGVNIYLH